MTCTKSQRSTLIQPLAIRTSETTVPTLVGVQPVDNASESSIRLDFPMMRREHHAGARYSGAARGIFTVARDAKWRRC